MSQKKLLLNSLVACEKYEFDKIIKIYLKEVYNYQKIILTDGKDDTGIDMKVFDSGIEKVQFQLTVQKSETQREKTKFEIKLFEDVAKARLNNAKYGYSNSLFFFYSRPLTNKSIREYQKRALSEFSINLTLIEANRIVEEAEEYLQLQKAIIDTNEIEKVVFNDSIFPESDKNLVFDLIGFGKSSDFKLQIIESFILQEILVNDSLNLNEILKSCSNKFGKNENNIFYNKLVNKLQSNKKIKKNNSSQYELTNEEKERLIKLKDIYDANERNFIRGIRSTLNSYSQEEHLEEYIMELKNIYINNFNTNIIELIDNLHTNNLAGTFKDFINFIKVHYKGSSEQIKSLAKELFSFCQEDFFLQKFCAGKVFSETSNLSRIEKYVNTQKKIFVDTQLAIYGLCFYHNPKSVYNNYYFNTTRLLINFCIENRIKLNLPDRYLWEVQTHLEEAFNLLPFTQLPNFTKLGKSRNVFYNYYLNYITEKEHISFDFFLDQFGFKSSDNYKKHNLIIESHLKKMGFQITSPTKLYEIEDTSRIIQYDLMLNHKFKTKFSLNNDAIVMEYLSDDDIEIHKLQPILLSWDKTFFNVQKIFFTKNPTYQRWFLMTPSRFIDQYSLLQFKIDSDTISSEMIAFLTDDIVQGTHALIDSIAFIFTNNEVSLEYANRLAEIRDNEIHRIQEKEIIPPENMEGEAVIDDVFYKLTTHYQENESSLEKFKSVFSDPALIDRVMEVIKRAIDNIYKKNKTLDNTVFVEFDSIINSVSA
ncbi:hypothetical protein FHS57_001946 [Runella defluvii]|uniref:Uncharacterized protein n=1 Tax=Runella defluvii TaxID=370973 RepID=A0A7W5ZLF1_9BACT|nr:hypothetical protein [Runella defluvii]MBB3837949.1 hypothetical protein [Runella defluvii]